MDLVNSFVKLIIIDNFSHSSYIMVGTSFTIYLLSGFKR